MIYYTYIDLNIETNDMSDTTNIVDIINKIHADLDKFKDNWLANNIVNPGNWPLEISNDNIGIVFEQFSSYDPDEVLDPCIDIDQYIQSIGFTAAYNIIKRRPPMAQVYNPANNSYYRMEAFCISLEELKDRLDELTKDLQVVASFDFIDKDWPYAYQELVVQYFNNPLEIDAWIEKNTGRRESYRLKELVWVDRK